MSFRSEEKASFRDCVLCLSRMLAVILCSPRATRNLKKKEKLTKKNGIYKTRQLKKTRKLRDNGVGVKKRRQRTKDRHMLWSLEVDCVVGIGRNAKKSLSSP